MRFSHLLFGALFLLPAGCPDPQGQFDAFKERDDLIRGGDGGTDTGGAPACAPTIEGEADGKYLFALSAVLDPAKAFALDATVTTHAADGGLTVDLDLQPLSAEDQMTPVGDPLSFTGLVVAADGTFDWDFGEITLVQAGNPINPLDVVSTLQLQGSICGAENLGFICGSATGIVSEPLPDFDLSGSTFTMQRYDTDLPAPVINCAKDPAVYE